MKVFESLKQLGQFLQEHGTYVFTSQPRKLSRFRVFLFSLATRDFNGAHVVPWFAPKSFFKGQVSHGIGTAARAEAEFLQLMGFELAPETIVEGLTVKYIRPLRVGATYQYTFTVSNLRHFKGQLWQFDCRITCSELGKGALLMDEEWHPIFVDHSEMSAEELKPLQPEPYLWSVIKYGPLALALDAVDACKIQLQNLKSGWKEFPITDLLRAAVVLTVIFGPLAWNVLASLVGWHWQFPSMGCPPL